MDVYMRSSTSARRTFKITNDETRAGYVDIMGQIDAAKLAVKRAAGTDDEQTAKAELQAKEQAATDYLQEVPEDQRAYGIISVGAALGASPVPPYTCFQQVPVPGKCWVTGHWPDTAPVPARCPGRS